MKFCFLSHDSVRFAPCVDGAAGLPPRSSSIFSQSVQEFVDTSARIFTVTAFFSFEIKKTPE